MNEFKQHESEMCKIIFFYFRLSNIYYMTDRTCYIIMYTVLYFMLPLIYNLWYFYFQANAVNFESVIPNLHHYKTKEVTPRAWNVSLSFGNIFCIKVCGYKKVL